MAGSRWPAYGHSRGRSYGVHQSGGKGLAIVKAATNNMKIFRKSRRLVPVAGCAALLLGLAGSAVAASAAVADPALSCCQFPKQSLPVCWGANRYGQLGNGAGSDSGLYGGVVGLSGVTQVAAGWDHGLALTSGGTVWAWGAPTVRSGPGSEQRGRAGQRLDRHH
jgi:hypothetical protein